MRFFCSGLGIGNGACAVWERFEQDAREGFRKSARNFFGPFEKNKVPVVSHELVETKRRKVAPCLKPVRIYMDETLKTPPLRKLVDFLEDKGGAVHYLFDAEGLRNRLGKGGFPRAKLAGKRDESRAPPPWPREEAGEFLCLACKRAFIRDAFLNRMNCTTE